MEILTTLGIIGVVAFGINFLPLPSGLHNFFKKLIGGAAIAGGVYATYALVAQGIDKMSKAAPMDTGTEYTKWIIIICIFVPVMIGLLIFGIYAIKGEYSS